MKLKSRCTAACLVTLASVLHVTPVLAQSGTLRYSPNLVVVPTGPLAMYITLALLLGLVGMVVMWRQQRGTTLSGLGALLFLGALGGAQFWLSSDAMARVGGGPTTFLSIPTGGTVTVPEGQQTFTNNSGVDLAIANLRPPCPVSNAATNACSIGLIVNDGDSCDTDYTCPAP